MSAVRVGSRLAHLHALRTRLDHEIAAETAREVDAAAGRHRPDQRPPAPPVPPAEARVVAFADLPPAEALTRLGVTPAQVRDWARTAGHRIASTGKLAEGIVALYVEAHPERQDA